MSKFVMSFLIVGLFASHSAYAADTVYNCEGTKEIKDTFGEVLLVLNESEAGEFSLSLDFGDGAAKTANAKCEPDGKATGILGLLTMNCTDEEGVVLPVEFNRNDLTLKASFQFPGFGSIPIETTCQIK